MYNARASDEETYDVIIASGCDVLACEIDLSDSNVDRGKENALRPTAVSETAARRRRLESSSTKREIQSISLSEDAGKLLMVDNFGVVDVMTRDVGGGGKFGDGSRLAAVGANDVEGVGGWCGAVTGGGEDGKIYVAKSSQRVVDLYDADRRVRRIRTLLAPYDIELTAVGNGGNVFVVAEGHQLAVYDDRIAERGGCANRISLGYNKPLYAVSTSRTPGLESVIACGGAERVVHVLDIRKWGAMERWRNAAKFDITQLELSTSSPGFAYVAGLDYECMCGSWRTQKSDGGFSFRADTRWMGLHSCKTACGRGDVLAGWAESGHVYALRTQPAIDSFRHA